MKIAIDLTAIPSELTGVGFYVKNLIMALSELNQKDRFLVFVSQKNHASFYFDRDNFEFVNVPDMPAVLRLIWEQIVLPVELMRQKIDLLHSPHYSTPILGESYKRVVTFCDMTFLLFPQYHQQYKTFYFKKMIRAALKKADRIISISNSTTRDIIRCFPQVDKQKISTIHLSAANIFQPYDDRAEIERQTRAYALPDKYLLYVGTLEPRKNIFGLLQAYNALEKALREAYKLVIVGKKGWHYEEIFKYVEANGLKDQVIFTGYIAEDILPYVYNGASLFIYPSFYEGFGIPVLEALKCGLPVITSNISSMPEIAGKAAILIDPKKPEEIAIAIGQVLNNSQYVSVMRQHSLAQAQKFSWRKCAAETVAVYKEALASQTNKGGK